MYKVIRIPALIIIYLISVAAYAQEAKQLTKLDFEEQVIPKADGWSFGSQSGGTISVSTDTSVNYKNSLGSLRGTYPASTGGAIYVWAGFDVAKLNLREVYAEFWASMPKSKQAVKFFKIFGQVDAKGGYANTTFGLGGEGKLMQISYGHGVELANDVQSVIYLTGSYPKLVGRSYLLDALVEAKAQKVWVWPDNKWHKFRIRAKFNSVDANGNEVADGAYYLEIDNTIYVDAINLLNRHKDNKPIQRIGFFDWAQSTPEPFEILFDDIVISTGGFMTSPQSPQAVKDPVR